MAEIPTDISEIPVDITMLCSGYTAKAWLNLGGLGMRQVLVTSFNCTFQKSYLQSKSMMRLSSSVSKVNRYGGTLIVDWPEMSLNLDIEPGLTDVINLFEHISNNRNAPSTVVVLDDSNNITWTFDKCYLNEATLNVEQNSNAIISLSFLVEPNAFGYDWTTRVAIPGVLEEETMNPEYFLPFEPLLPYWAWKLSMESKDVTGFTISFNQSINPQYECSGSNTPMPFAALFFSLPEVKLDVNYVFAEAGGAYNLDVGYQLLSLSTELEEQSATLEINGQFIAAFTGLFRDSVTPTFVGSLSLNETYTVTGTIKTVIEGETTNE